MITLSLYLRLGICVYSPSFGAFSHRAFLAIQRVVVVGHGHLFFRFPRLWPYVVLQLRICVKVPHERFRFRRRRKLQDSQAVIFARV